MILVTTELKIFLRWILKANPRKENLLWNGSHPSR